MKTTRNKELRNELIDIVKQIMACPDNEAKQDALVRVFESKIQHPAGADLIFYPKNSPEPTAEEIVDEALSYEPPLLT